MNDAPAALREQLDIIHAQRLELAVTKPAVERRSANHSTLGRERGQHRCRNVDRDKTCSYV